MMSKRYEKFDVLRAFAILGVVLIHTTAPLATDGEVFSVVVNQASRFAVPAFFILSGWGLTISNSLERSKNYVSFIKKRLWGLLPLYLMWNVVYLFSTGSFKEYTSLSLSTLNELAREIFLGGIHSHLYFVPIISLFYIIYPLLLKYTNERNLLWALGITIVSQLLDYGFTRESFYMDNNPLNWFFYFILGIWLAQNFEEKIEKIKQYKIPITAGVFISFATIVLTAFLGESIFGYDLALASTRPSVIIYSSMIIAFTMVTAIDLSFLNKILLPISKYSYYIYLSHYFFVDILRDLLVPADWADHSIFFTFFTFLLVVGFSFVTSIGMEKVARKLNI